MERHKCKLCMRSFSNGRALGGHMRSHMMNLPIPPKIEDSGDDEEEEPHQKQLAIDELADSVSASSSISASSSSEDEDEEHEEDEEGLFYGLRENPKRSIRLVDPEFNFSTDAVSVVLQDRESETESSKNPTRRRSKRTRKSAVLDLQQQQCRSLQKDESFKKIKVQISSKTDSFEPEQPVSSISDATTEEDVAFCLMMLSRDKWKNQELLQQQYEDDQEQDQYQYDEMANTDESSEQIMIKFPRNRTARGKYKCETCNKVFKSYQALGGHRASHKKIKASNPIYEPELEKEHNAGNSSVNQAKTHECPVCFRAFSSGQALGGHKRSHVIGTAASASASVAIVAPAVKRLAKLGDNLIDLNLPAPVEDDEISQIELSAVSDAEFIRR